MGQCYPQTLKNVTMSLLPLKGSKRPLKANIDMSSKRDIKFEGNGALINSLGYIVLLQE